MTTQRESRPGGRAGGGGAWDKRLARATLSASHYSTAAQKRQMPVYNSAGRVVGHLTPDGWLEKVNLDPAKHMLRRPPAWATDADHLEIADLKGIRIITTTGEVWEADIATWRRFGILINRGHGSQVCLPVAYWRHSKGEAEAAQLTLPLEVTP